MKLILIFTASIFLAAACTNLDEEYYSVVPASEYGTSSEEIKTIAGSAYASLRGFGDAISNAYPASEYVYFLVETVSDEVCVPTRGADWYDNGRYQDAQYHDIKADNAMVLSAWRYCFEGISKCNFVIYTIEEAGMPEEEEMTAKAEVRGVRAYYYYLLLDWFGNVPIVTSFTDSILPANSQRSEVYSFVEDELTEIIDYLQPTVEYGRFTQNVGNTLLARLYINSEVFIGTARWNECIEACNKVSGYSLTESVLDNFLTENEFSEEIIFAVPYDRKEGTAGNYLPSLSFHYNQWRAISASAAGWTWAVNGICAQPGVYSSFEPGDERINCMEEGVQLAVNGDTIFDRTGAVLDYTEEIENFTDAKEYEGVRLKKMEIKEGEFPERDHDLVVMRYAEVLMMKAECLWRTGQEPQARSIVNQIRDRSGLGPVNMVNEDVLDMEWLHEFLFEGIRRGVNIRFGTFFQPWWEKPSNTPLSKAIFPIPETELVKNSNLIQNPGY